MSEYDIRHLVFIYQRLIHIHKENVNVDYMLKFKEIIESIPYLSHIKVEE